MATSIVTLDAGKPRRRSAAAASLPELALLVAGMLLYILMPEDLGFATRLFIAALFTLSLDFVLG